MRVKGTVIIARLDFARSKGPEVLERFYAALDPGTREMLQGVLPNQWFPYELNCEITRVIDRVAGSGDLSLCEEMGRFACDANVPRFLRAFLRLGSIEFFLNRAAAAWRAHYDTGSMEVIKLGPKKVRLRLVGIPNECHAQCLSVVGFVKRAGELTGTTIASGSVTACRERGAQECELTGSWH
ncbi:MAG TPA: hypothetical protein VK524_06220 [Polyangiaceae bacterium]|nr:hypothetical protein [Polyangiaceae bacterium]